jgi:molybdopterin-synthase adenylyltransferase
MSGLRASHINFHDRSPYNDFLSGGLRVNEGRYSRQSFLGSRAQQAFEGAVVGLVGLGGGGSHIVQQLAHIGFLHYNLFDDDVIEETNLNRVVGATLADVRDNAAKLTIAERTIRGLQPLATVGGYRAKWQEEAGAVQQCHIVFGCIDSFVGREELERFCRRHQIAYIDIGMDIVIGKDKRAVMGGQVILSIPGHACMRCLGFLTDDRLAREAEEYGGAGPRPQVVWPNAILASTAVGIAVDLLTDWTNEIRGPVFVEYDGNRRTLKNRASQLARAPCTHFPNENVGVPTFRTL